MLTRLGALRLANATAWQAVVRRAMRQAGGDVGAAAAALGVGRRTLERWLLEPAFNDLQRARRPRSDRGTTRGPRAKA